MTESLSQLSTFLHPVGISTLKYGITIPVEAQTDRLLSIPKGEKIPVTIIYPGVTPVVAEVRRLNNSVGHLQFRYEKVSHSQLRDALSSNFGDSLGGLLEVAEIKQDVFQITPFSTDQKPTLQFKKFHGHNIAAAELFANPEIEKIRSGINSVAYDPLYSQAAYNTLIKDSFVSLGWKAEPKVVDTLGLKCDFERGGIWVEVEFGNARTYYQDFIKFIMARDHREAQLGLLVCPVDSFAAMLCELGRSRAAGGKGKSGAASYSGMMSFEKAERELPYFGRIFDMPIAIAGVGFSTKALHHHTMGL